MFFRSRARLFGPAPCSACGKEREPGGGRARCRRFSRSDGLGQLAEKSGRATTFTSPARTRNLIRFDPRPRSPRPRFPCQRPLAIAKALQSRESDRKSERSLRERSERESPEHYRCGRGFSFYFFLSRQASPRAPGVPSRAAFLFPIIENRSIVARLALRGGAQIVIGRAELPRGGRANRRSNDREKSLKQLLSRALA